MEKLSTKKIQQVISDIAGGFASIDQKVMELTEVSNDDFSALNNILKNHHTTTHEIANSTIQIMDQIQSLNDNPALLSLRSASNAMKTATKEANENLKTYRDQINLLNQDFKHIFIPILNFKQNISTLKFLMTNLKINQGVFNNEQNIDTELLIEKLNKKIEEIQAEIPLVANDVEVLKSHYQKAYKEADAAQKNFSGKYELQVEKLLQVISLIDAGIEQTASIKTKVEQKNQENFQNLNQVITNLQYHDIIRQKIEHIQDTHKNIVSELNNLEKEHNIIKKGLDYINQIPGITEIQAGQLLLTNKEYQTAIENISKKLIETANTLETVNDLSFSIFNAKDEKKIWKQLKTNSEELPDQMQQACSVLNDLVDVNKHLQIHIKNHMGHYQKLEAIEKDINDIIAEINRNLAPQNEIKTITGKLVNLLNDINDSRLNIGKIITAHQNNQLINIIEKIIKQKSALENQRITGREMDNFINDFTNINERITGNCNSLKKLETQLKSTLENIKYYDFYEHEVEAIIEQLNIIYQKIKPISTDENLESNLLTAMEKAYTMESQREIHQHKDSEEDKNEEDDNLELF